MAAIRDVPVSVCTGDTGANSMPSRHTGNPLPPLAAQPAPICIVLPGAVKPQPRTPSDSARPSQSTVFAVAILTSSCPTAPESFTRSPTVRFWIAPVHSVLIWVGGQRHLLFAQDGRHTLVGSQALRRLGFGESAATLARGR